MKHYRDYAIILFFVGLIITLSFIEPVLGSIVTISVTIIISKYLNTSVHEFGHFLVGKLCGFNIKEVIIGERLDLRFLRFKLGGTVVSFNFGSGGCVTADIVKSKYIKSKLVIYILGGILLQIIVGVLVYSIFGIGQGDTLIPLIYEVVTMYSVGRSLMLKKYYFDNKLYPSDGLLALRILKMKEEKFFKNLEDDSDIT